MSTYMQLGQAAIQARNTEEAVTWFTKLVEEEPKNAQALSCLGQSLCWLGKREQGLVHLRNAGKQLLKSAKKTKDVALPILLAEQLQYWEDYPGALDLARQVVQINSAELGGFRLLAVTYLRLNQNKLALAAARQALKLAPDNAVINILLAPLEAADGQRDVAKQRLEKVLNGQLSPEQSYRAHKELALILDKQAQYSGVFPHLHAAAEASALIPEVQNQDAQMVPNMIKANKAGFDHALLSRWADAEFPDSPAPIFLVGFLRSGTTMTQEVLGAHPDVFVSDETDFIPALSNELKKLSGNVGSTIDQLKNIDFAGVLHLRQLYWELAKSRFGDNAKRRFYLDKTTMNTIDLGLINCIFPDAKVVFVIRDPRDICLSCYMQIMTPTASTIQLLNWQNTASFYALTMDWWLHFKQLTTMDFIEFRYEDAVTDFEGTYRQVFDFLGLDWHPDVINFHQSAAKKHIVSPSFNQVTQPLYATSVARWQRYQSEFTSISPLLEPYINIFGYRTIN